jgi:hypothetical protein
MEPARFLRHWWTGLRGAGRAFTADVRATIEREITAAEAQHAGEIRFAIEPALHLPLLWHGVSPRQRALAAFSSLGVWDTSANNGVLIYVLLADRAVEVVADRGIAARVSEAEWSSLCREIETHFRRADFDAGSQFAVRGVARLLALHFPPVGPHRNELPNQAILL